MRMTWKMTWKSDFSAEDGEGAAAIMRMTTTTMKSIRTDTQHTIVVPSIFPYMIPITVYRVAARSCTA
jgi:hypothetical protein